MNIKHKSITTFILILALVFTFTACGNTTLAKIKDSTITQEQLDSYVSYYALISFTQSKSELSEENLAYLNSVLLNFAVEVEVLKQHFKAEGVNVLPDDYDDLFAKHKETLFSQSKDMEKKLIDAGVTDEALEFFFSSQFYTKKFMEEINEKDPVTNKEMKAYYKENKDSLVSPAQIKASHILVEDTNHSDAGKTSIEAIKTKIENGDATFEEMAKNNPDSTAETGGDLGWFSKGDNVEEFDKAAFALEKGKMSDVVETEFGYHLILVTDKSAEHQKTFDEAKDEIKLTLEEQRYAAGIEELKKEIGVEFTKEGQKLIDGTSSGNE